MISATAPMMALTITVAAVAWSSYDRANGFDSGALADGMARHHFLVLRDLLSNGAAGAAAGVRPDPDVGPFNLHDWQSEVFVNADGTWLITYAEDYANNPGLHGTAAMDRVPDRLQAAGVRAPAFGLWPELDGNVAGFAVGGRDFAMPPGGFDGVIAARAPVIISRVD